MSLTFSMINHDEGKVITVFVPGRDPQVAFEDHPNFNAILEGALAGDESVLDLFDVATTAADRFEGLSERVSVANGRVYLDGDEVHNSLTTQIIRFIDEGRNFQPLVEFFENVQSNPNEHSKEQLYGWLDARDFTINEDGMIVGYKGVYANGDGFTSTHSGPESDGVRVNGESRSGRIYQEIGDVVEMPRANVHHDPASGCSTGLHVADFYYAKSYGNVVLEVVVNPRDVVSVPTETNWNKVRVCRYVVSGVVDAPYTDALKEDTYLSDVYPEDDYGDEDDDSCGDPTCSWCHPELEDNYLSDNYVDDSADPDYLAPDLYKGDVYEDTDPRRNGRTLTVEGFDFARNKVIVRGDSGLTRKISLPRLKSRKYRLV